MCAAQRQQWSSAVDGRDKRKGKEDGSNRRWEFHFKVRVGCYPCSRLVGLGGRLSRAVVFILYLWVSICDSPLEFLQPA